MKTGIMQPYFFPYIGYWQLMNIVDVYVIFDDVNYINRGWINRNRILNNGEPMYFNLGLIGASQNKLINEIEVSNDEKQVLKNLKTIQMIYAKAPFFKDVYPILVQILTNPEKNLAAYLKNSFEVVSKYLNIETNFILSSNINKSNELKGQDKILDICKKLNTSEYYNAIGGQELYDYEKFKENGIELNFVKPILTEYKQFKNEFVPGLSIVDIMMFNSPERIKEMLNSYEIINHKQNIKKI